MNIRLPIRSALLALTFALLAGCGGGAETQSNPPPLGGTPVDNYAGPAPANDDVQAFRLAVWDRLKAGNRCGSCHGADQAPIFARVDDVNLAYDAALPMMDRDTPANSRLVTKIGGGHHCWIGTDATSNGNCASLIAGYVAEWAAGSSGGGSTTIELEAPPERDVGASKPVPSIAPAAFGSHLHPLLTQHCAECHSPSVPARQSPFFAGSDVAAAWDAAKSRIDLDNPVQSRLAVRLTADFHNCWSDDCGDDAAALVAAIEAIADDIVADPPDPELKISKALRLVDGQIAAGGARYEQNLIAKYEFMAGTGSTAIDTSGVDPEMHLTLSGDVAWVGGWGIEFGPTGTGKAQASTAASGKLAERIKATGEYSMEAWVVPGNVNQENSRIVSYSGGVSARNFTLGQTKYSYELYNRSAGSDNNGAPLLATADADQILQATQQHVVITYDPSNGRRLYVNGELLPLADPAGGASLASWDDTYALVLGNEVSGNRPWQGKLRFVALYNRALDGAQVAQNFAAGVGEKHFLLFGVGDLVDIADAYVMFEVSLFDSYSYLFDRPTFVVLGGGAPTTAIPIEGMRIGLNGREVAVGQVYQNLATSVDATSYGEGGQLLSSLGAVIGGGGASGAASVESDEFFLSFERLGAHTHVVVEAEPAPPPAPADRDPSPEIGLRTFDEVNASMSAITGVSPNQSDVRDTFATLRQQLPSDESVGGFLSAHQMGVAQLAVEYCNVLVDDSGLRGSVFPAFNFNVAANAAFATPSQVIDPLLDRVLGLGLESQPKRADAGAELEALIVRLAGPAACAETTCNVDRTAIVVKAVCAAALGSAALLIQ